MSADQRYWVPLPGPQTWAYESEADEIFFGGAAGGGKSALILGIAGTLHQSSIIFRREYPQLKELVNQSRRFFGSVGKYNGQDHTWKLDERELEFGAVQHEWDVQKYQGRPHDFIGFDELPQISRSQYRFLSAWNRTTVPGQRCRIVATGNPPQNAEERWVIEEWAPWLDKQHPNPAKPGEVRYFTVKEEKTIWLPSDDPIAIGSRVVKPRSRTFIPSMLKDNPLLSTTDYGTLLENLPEPWRSQLLEGDFTAGMEDDPQQVIPTAWVNEAMKRWKPDGCDAKLSCIGVDIARGGKAKTVASKRYGFWWARLLKWPGYRTPDGPSVADLLQVHVMENPTEVKTNVDIIGVGSAVFDEFKRRGWSCTAINFAKATKGTDRTGLLHFSNYRSWAYWCVRDLLDPSNGHEAQIPPDAELLGDLTAPKWKSTGGVIQLEKKEDIEKRLGRSVDCGDSFVYSVVQTR